MFARQHFVKNQTCTPYVTFLVVILRIVKEICIDLRTSIKRCATLYTQIKAILFGQTKIAYFYITSGSYQNIIWLEISMQYTFGIHIAHSLNDLTEQIKSFFLGQALLNQARQNSSWAILNKQINIISNFFETIKSNNVWMNKRRELLQSLDFVMKVLWFVHMLYCNFTFFYSIIAFINFTKAPLPKLFFLIQKKIVSDWSQIFLLHLCMYYCDVLCEIYKEFIILTHQTMGNLFSKILSQFSSPRNYFSSPENEESGVQFQLTDIEIWHKSSKNPFNLIELLESQASEQQKHKTALLYLSTINDRDKLQNYLQELQKYLLQLPQGSILPFKNQQSMLISESKIKQCKINMRNRQQIFKQIHYKYCNLWFTQSAYTKNSFIYVSQKQLEQLQSNQNYGQKVHLLYSSMIKMINNSNKNETAINQFIFKALLSNYPLLLTQETLHYLIKLMIQDQIYLLGYNQHHFDMFMTAIIQWGNLPQSKALEYTQKVMAMLEGQENERYKEIMELGIKQLHETIMKYSERNWVIHCLIDASKQFLKVGNPHSMELIFKCAIKINYKHFLPQEQHLYLYTKIYSLYLYELESSVELNFFTQLYKMSICDIIHLLMAKNELKNLQLLETIFREVKHSMGINKQSEKVHDQYEFSKWVSQYMFSNYCTLSLCVKILNETGFINLKANAYDCHSKFTQKLRECKFDVFIENQHGISKLIQNIANHCGKPDDEDSFISMHSYGQIVDVINLLYIMGVNQKVNEIWIFYEPSQSQSNSHNTILQQKALYILKSLISKYFTNKKSKKITVGHKSKKPVSYDLSQPQSLFSLCNYLYAKIFNKVIKSESDIHQIIFQHLLYFYKYDQLKELLNSLQFLEKYNISYEKVEILIIQNITQEFLRCDHFSKISKDISLQLKMLKTKSIENQAISATYSLLKYLSQEQCIQLNGQHKQNISIELLYWLVKKYPEKLESLNFDYVYEKIRLINSEEVKQDSLNSFDVVNSEQYIMTNQLLQFKSKLSVKAYQNNLRKLGADTIQEICGFNPPWITSTIIEILKISQNNKQKIDNRLFMLALKYCMKGKDLDYLLRTYQKNSNDSDKISNMKTHLAEYLEIGKQYLIIDEEIVLNDYQFSNFIAESKFSDETLAQRNYQLFYALLGTQPDRAFYHAFKAELDILKIQVLLRQGMKLNIFNVYNTIMHQFRLAYFVYHRNQYDRASFKDYKNKIFKLEQLVSLKKIQQSVSVQKSNAKQFQIYKRLLNNYIYSQKLPEKFLDRYLKDQGHKSKNIKYQILNQTQSPPPRLNALLCQFLISSNSILLEDVPDFKIICCEILNMNYAYEICLNQLACRVNVAQTLSQQSKNIVRKLVIVVDNQQIAARMICELCDQVFSIKIICQILVLIKQEDKSSYFDQIISLRHLQILCALAAVEQGQQFAGIIPSDFFNKQIGYQQLQENIQQQRIISEKHYNIINNSRKKTNIFVLSKVMYFFYGMDQNIQRQVLEDYLNSEEADQEIKIMWATLKEEEKLSQMK